MQDNDKTQPAADEAGIPAPEDAASAPEETAVAEEDTRDLRIAELEAELATVKDQQLRALAEVENMRRRAQREREEALKYGAVSLARDLLSVADNLGRALATAPDDEAVKSLVDGVAMVERDLAGALEKHHVRLVPGVGEPFDHNVHQAVVEIDAPDVPAGHVAQVLQSGYTMHERLLRPSMVAVAKAGAQTRLGD